MKLKNTDYHNKKGYISASMLKGWDYFNEYLVKLNNKGKTSKAMSYGSLFHCLLMEPQNYDKEFICEHLPDPDRPKTIKVNKDYMKQLKLDAGDRSIVTPQNLKDANNGIYHFKGTYKDYDKYFNDKTIYEDSLFCEDFAGLKVKIRPDLYIPHEFMGDVKTCKSISDVDFGKQAYELGYYLQASFYKDVYQLLTGQNLSYIWFAFCGDAPYNYNVFEMTETQYKIGQLQYMTQIQKILEAGDLPCIEGSNQCVTPPWIINKYKNVLEV